MGDLGHWFLVGGMNSVFSEQILADKLSKLNSTQQCIESILLPPPLIQFSFCHLIILIFLFGFYNKRLFIGVFCVMNGK